MIRVAAAQMRSGESPDANLEAMEVMVADAVGRGARYVLTPEVSVAFAANKERLAEVAGPETSDGAFARLGELARTHGVHLHLGSLAVALEDGRFANRSVLFGPDGEVVASYDKIHLFDADVPGDKGYRESATYRGGDTAVVARAAGFGLGFSVCYDVRFPALYAALADAGAEVIAIPAAFTVPTGRAHWETLLRARAIETGSYVIAAAQGGRHENGRATYGHSMIVDPWGEIIAQTGDDRPGLITADIDLGRVADARRRIPALANRRAFSLSVNPEVRK
jgi:deaminated glutathione amidase